MYQGLTYIQDLKLGHYLKVPPRSLFFAQTIASLWGCIVQVAVLYWAFGNIDDICQPEQSGRFTCPNGRVFFTASVIWCVNPVLISSIDKANDSYVGVSSVHNECSPAALVFIASCSGSG